MLQVLFWLSVNDIVASTAMMPFRLLRAQKALYLRFTAAAVSCLNHLA